MGTRHSACLSWCGRSQVLASPGTTPSWDYKACLTQPLVVHCAPKGSSLWPLWPPPPVCEYTWLKNCHPSQLSSVEWYVFGYSHNPRAGIPLHKQDEEEAINTSLLQSTGCFVIIYSSEFSGSCFYILSRAFSCDQWERRDCNLVTLNRASSGSPFMSTV